VYQQPSSSSALMCNERSWDVKCPRVVRVVLPTIVRVPPHPDDSVAASPARFLEAVETRGRSEIHSVSTAPGPPTTAKR